MALPTHASIDNYKLIGSHTMTVGEGLLGKRVLVGKSRMRKGGSGENVQSSLYVCVKLSIENGKSYYWDGIHSSYIILCI